MKSMRQGPASFLMMFLCVLLAVAGPAAAQETAEPARSGIVTEQLDALQAELVAGQERLTFLLQGMDVLAAEAWLGESPLERLRERVADAALPEAERAEWQKALDQEQADVERVRGALSRAELALAAKDRLRSAEARVEAMRDSLNPPAVDQQRPLSQIEQEIATLASLRLQVGLELNQNRQTVARLEDQLRTQAETLDSLRREREQARAASAGESADGQAAVVSTLPERGTEASIITAQLDSQSRPPRIERLRLEIRVQELEDQRLGERLTALQAEFNLRSTAELRALSGELKALLEREPEVARLHGETVARLYGQIDRIEQAQRRIRALQLEREEGQRIETDLSQVLSNVRERLEVGGLSETLGSLFLEEQRRLRALGDKRFVLRTVERELSQARLRNITLREELSDLGVPFPISDEDPGRAALLDLQKQTLAALVQAEESLADQLRRTGAQLGAVVSLVDELDQVLRETLIWWPSHVPVGLDWLKRVPVAVLALLELSSWEEVHSALLQVTVQSPVSSVFLLLLVGLLWYLGQGVGEELRVLAAKTRHRFTDNMRLTFKAMGWSLLRVLPVPVLLMSTSYRLQQVSGAGAGVEIFATVLFSAATWWLAGHLFLLFTSRHGVGTAHFDWPVSVVRRLRRNLAWYLPSQFILILCLALAFVHPSDQVFDVLGRAGLVAAAVLAGVLAWRLLAPNSEISASARIERRRRLLRVAVTGYMVALVVLALAGYLLTVSELLTRSLNTAVVVGGVWLGYRLSARALVLSEERLRFRRMREERAKAAALESHGGVTEGIDLPEAHLSMEDINHQTHALLKVTARVALVLALVWVWKDILPALTWLDGVTAWERTVGNGEEAVLIAVTWQDLLLAGLLAALFLMASRNLPGLVEILLTRATDMDPSGRYTVATLLRYTMIIVMVISVFPMLGLRWSELQWMVAALTLGLGFGLQEVVANFVSGLIMLFERPVRVGDTITIGEYSGTVGRIRTRATTIVDWDNREILVPNKNFITERLINWTLSDTVTRIVVTVGVTYDSDVDLVMQTLEEIAEGHALVLDDPAPTVVFLRMGESALTFELRAYVSQLRDRLDTSSALHRDIVRAFRERGIRLAYPQMGVHMGGTEAVRELPAARAELPMTVG